ncbi:site-specific integrase [Bradyrhizobium sp. Ash2021]|uniref:tyrosine-type recombinase/integrase n=1 Tax=Bradyrhizobium sp. Ash2021 TaxID=2954771 RepID=UPI0028149CB9|nr:site-specific integrase [Bradyrhizobium sp. Ash2021]WMT78744.1 site-specific integrase [Bradyrhizobium sp. Ash2021]
MTKLVRSLPLALWPTADRQAWQDASRPGFRLKRGGAASHLAEITRNDLARRYGYFLDFLHRTSRLDPGAGPAAQVSPENVREYLAELQARVRSVTVHGSIYKLRRAAELISGGSDFTWLAEIEKDLAFVVVPKSKFNRIVTSEVLVEAGLALIAEADANVRTELSCARSARNGLMIALLALNPMRLKNFAALEIGGSFVEVKSTWWVKLNRRTTKSRRVDERPLPDFLKPAIDAYINRQRPILARSDTSSNALWVSSNDGSPMTYDGVARVLSATTLATIGVDVSAHLFRGAAATTAAVYGGSTPHLASAVLHHTDPRVTEAHYNRATNATAGQTFQGIIDEYR